ncbi:MAG: glutathione S-transferase N-terminal domain-containing protein [Gaiellaceae bacterium]
MQMLELFQTEWCPASRHVRQRLTELGLDYVNCQVPVDRTARTALLAAVGSDTIPALRLENGSAVVGEESILVYLSEHFAEPLEAEAHQQKAAKARRRYLEEECECLQAATPSVRGRRSRLKRPSSASARS